MKKNFVPKLIFGILSIILFIAIIYAITHKEKKLTLEMYNNICNNENYTFSMKEENTDINYSLIVSKRKNDINIETKSDDDYTSTLIKDGIAYYILHSEKEYYLYDSGEIDADIIKNGLSEIDKKEYTSGYEKINDKTLYYEEYEGISTFFIWSKYDETNTIKTRFYFNNGKIQYIKTTEGETEELLKVDFSENVDESVFEIPKDYAEK